MFYYKKSNNTSTNLFIEEEGYGSFNIISIICLVSANFIDGCNWTTEENRKAVASHWQTLSHKIDWGHIATERNEDWH